MLVDLDPQWFSGRGYEKCDHALSLLSRRGGDDDLQLIDDAIALTTSAETDAVTPAGQAVSHFLLGTAYNARYEITGSLTDLTWALRRMRQAVEEDNPGHNRGGRLQRLSDTLLTVIEMLEPGEQLAADHLRLAEQWLREAMPLLDPAEAAMCESSLGLVYFERARHFGEAEALGRAVECLNHAAESAKTDIDRAKCFGNLGKVLMYAYNMDPSTDRGANLLAAYQTAVSLSPADHPDHAIHERHLRIARETLGVSSDTELPELQTSPWLTMNDGTELNTVTGEVRRPSDPRS